MKCGLLKVLEEEDGRSWISGGQARGNNTAGWPDNDDDVLVLELMLRPG
jgi:hypothetical protein